METEKTFKTKTGFCHVLPDKIVLTRDGILENASMVNSKNSIAVILIIYGILAVTLLYFAFTSFNNNGKVFQPIFAGLLGVFLLVGIFTSLNNSSTPVIHRKSIKSLKLKKAIPGLTRSRFEVFFEDENGKIKKRLIMLPGSLTNGEKETEKAINIMTEEELI